MTARDRALLVALNQWRRTSPSGQGWTAYPEGPAPIWRNNDHGVDLCLDGGTMSIRTMYRGMGRWHIADWQTVTTVAEALTILTAAGMVPDRWPDAPAALRLAARHIDQHGWTQDVYETTDGECCVLGAVGAVVGVDPFDETFPEQAPVVALAESLVRQGCIRTSEPWTRIARIALWNDDDARTKGEILAALNAAADELDAEAGVR